MRDNLQKSEREQYINGALPLNENDQEIQRLIAAITRFSYHIPGCVLEYIVNNEVVETAPMTIPLGDFNENKGENIANLETADGTRSPIPLGKEEKILEQQNKETLMASPVYGVKKDIHEAALLFVDISGFTKLSTLLDIEQLSTVINSYFDLIVDEVINFGGQVVKFAGDAIFAEWPTALTQCKPTANGAYENEIVQESPLIKMRRSEQKSRRTIFYNLQEATMLATSCGASILRKGTDFEVLTTNNFDVPIYLNVSCGVGCGTVVAMHAGCISDAIKPENREEERNFSFTKMEFLLLGDPIDQATKAEQVADRGEMAASSEVVEILSKAGLLSKAILCTSLPKVIVTRYHSYLLENEIAPKRESLGKHNAIDDILMLLKAFTVQRLEEICYKIAQYVHPVVKDIEMEHLDLFYHGSSSREVMNASPCSEQEQQLDRGRHREEAELRNVFTIFIKPLISVKLGDDETKNERLYALLNSMMILVVKELEKYGGHLRQFIVE